MTGDEKNQVESLFAEAVDLDPAQRDALLSARCGDNADLRREVEALLDHASRSGNTFLDTSPVRADMFAIDDDPGLAEGQVIGERYTLVRQVGAGGMGAVYLARQTEPFQRDVALKVVRPGIGTSGMLARFEQERRTLARLNHPNIAAVYDAGLTPTRQPFFVMEWAGEQTLLEYIRSREHDLPAALALFLDVCAAVQYAHQNGVIHRDLKPSNLLVSSAAGRPVVKVIDFGIAKLVSEELDDTMTLTIGHQPIGTPLYMSPEQAAGSPDIDTRSDVYALGAILFELLTGSPPFGRTHADNQRTTLPELLRMIREDEPVRPSQRAPERAAVIRGELDWITLKALEKDPDRRYPTTAALADDIARYRKREPVEAGPPGAMYRVRTFTRRHRAGVAAAALVIATMIAATTVSIRFAISEANQRRVAEANESRANEQAARAETEAERAGQAERIAEQRLTDLRQVVEFQSAQILGTDTALMGVELRRGLLDEHRRQLDRYAHDDDAIARAQSELDAALGYINFTNLAVATIEKNMIDEALRAARDQFAQSPAVQARLLESIARMMHDMGLIDRAVETQQEALDIWTEASGDHGLHVVRARMHLADFLRSSGNWSQAEQLGREVLAHFRDELGDDHPDALSAASNLGILLREQGRHDEAEPYYLDVFETRQRVLGEHHPSTLSAMSGLGFLRYSQGRYDEAETLFRSVVEQSRDDLGDRHPDTLRAMNTLGGLLSQRGAFDEAEPLLRQAADEQRALRGDDHPNTINAIANLGYVLRELGQTEEAESLYREALERRRRVLGNDHPDTLLSIANFGFLLNESGRTAEAEPYYFEALERRRRILGDDHPDTLNSLNNTGYLLRAQGKLDEAAEMYRDALEARTRTLGPTHPDTLISIINLASLHCQRDHYDDADALLASALDDARNTFTGGSARILGIYLQMYGQTRRGQKQFSEAEAFLLEAWPLLADGYGEHHPRTLDCATHLEQLYRDWHEHEPGADYHMQAEQWRRRANTAEPTGES